MKTQSKLLEILGIKELDKLCLAVQYCTRQYIGTDNQGKAVYVQGNEILKKKQTGYEQIRTEDK